MRSMVFILACILCAPALAGDVYKWKDAQGNTHYGDKPKTGGEEVDIRTGGGNGPKLHDPDAVKAQADHDAECKRKQAQLDLYRKAPSIREVDANGNSRDYTPAEREKMLAQTQKEADAACAPLPPS